MTGSMRRMLAAVVVGGAALTGITMGVGGAAQAATTLGVVVFDTGNLSPRGDWGKAYGMCKRTHPRTVSVRLIALGYRTQDTQAYWDQKWACVAR